MKIYLFNEENGLYEGESFEEADMLQHEEGLTPIAPPDFEHGQVPLFDRGRKEWSLVPIEAARRLLGNKTAGSGE